MQAYDRLTAAFPSTGTSHEVAVRAPADQAPAVKAALADLVRAHADATSCSPQDGLEEPQVSKDGTVTVLEVATPYEGGSQRGARLADQAAQRPDAGRRSARCRASSTPSAGSWPRTSTTPRTPGTSCRW